MKSWLPVVLANACPTIGGQAVLEGVMMRSPKSFAVAVRKKDGSIVVREEAWLSFSARYPFLKWPLLRGATMLVESLYNGMSALQFSGEVAMQDEVDAAQEKARAAIAAHDEGSPVPPPKAVDEVKPPSKAAQVGMLVTSLALAFLLFKGVPHMAATALGLTTQHASFHLVDGGIKLAIFVGYILFISRMNDVKRLFMYHGAEHKSVHAYEKAVPLDVENTRPQSTAHPRCGTALILLVLVLSVFVFAAVFPFVPVVSDNAWLQGLFGLALKAPLMLPIAGLAYEAQRLAARHPNNPLVKAIIAPGMLMQRLTTRTPGDPEVEVALTALQKTLWREAQGVVDTRRAAEVETFSDFAAAAQRLGQTTEARKAA